MADWADTNPTLTTAYAQVLQALRDRDIDAGSLFFNAPTNPKDRLFRYNRANDVFEEYQTADASWHPKAPSVAGGGTGATTAAGARTNLGLGTMATQAANAVAITGGSISGLSSLGVNGAVTFSGGLIAGSGAVGIIDATGKIPALSAPYIANLSAAALTLIPAAQLSGLVPTANLGSGVASAATFLRGDQSWAAPAGVLPSGLIAIFDAACPGGWTRVAAFDNLFVRGAAAYGTTGGADTHAHTITSAGGHTHAVSGSTDNADVNHAHSYSTDDVGGPSSTATADEKEPPDAVATLASASHGHHVQGNTSNMIGGNPHNHTFSAATGSSGSHTHTETTENNVPAYINVVFCKKN